MDGASASQVNTGSMATPNSKFYESLTRRHGVKVNTKVSVEDCCKAAGKAVGLSSLVSASRMNSGVVIFLNTVEKANELVQSGVVIDDMFVQITPLSTPAKKIILANIPPFIKDENIVQELSRFGKVVSPIRKIPMGIKSQEYKHMISHRRLVYMILKDNADELELNLKFKVDGFDYPVYASSESIMKCFKCGKVGHIVRDCPDRHRDDKGESESAEKGKTPSTSVPNTTEVIPDIDTMARSGTLAVEEIVVTSLELEDPKKEKNISLLTQDKEEQIKEQVGETMSEGLEVNLAKEQAHEAETEIDMEDEPLFKVPNKRKKQVQGKSNKQAKTEAALVEQGDSDNEGSLSDSGWSVCSQEENKTIQYTVEKVKTFLRITKGQKGVRVEDYFPDCLQFVNDVKQLKRDGAFSAPEVYRLKKILTKLNNRENNEEEF